MNAPQPIVFVTTDGAERKFSLSNKKTLLMQQEARDGNKSKDNLDVLWICCDDKNGVDRDDFVELFPLADPDVIGGLVKAIMDEWTTRNKSNPANEKYRPTKAEIQPSDGSGSPPSGELTLVA